MTDRHEAIGIAVAGLILFGGGTVLSFCAPSEDVPSVEQVPTVALEAAMADYRPQDVSQSPDEYDASADYCWDRYLEMSAFYFQAELARDSLSRELYRARGRIADLERGVER